MRKGKIHVRSTDKHVLATRPAKLTLAVSSPTRAGSSTRIVVKGCVLPVDDFRSSSARSFGSTFSIPSNKIWPEILSCSTMSSVTLSAAISFLNS